MISMSTATVYFKRPIPQNTLDFWVIWLSGKVDGFGIQNANYPKVFDLQ